MTILVTGGTGFIGSHTCVELLEAGYDVVVVDNFVNSKRSMALQVEAITGRSVPVFELDVRDKNSLRAIFSGYDIRSVLHFAGLKAVGESVAAPMEYYSANVGSSQTLVEVMAEFAIKTLVFSSSATVYGDPEDLPISERSVMKRPSNPYGRSKFFVEEMLADLRIADSSWRVGVLRYFNPVGAHPSGLIGEDLSGTHNNLMPIVAATALGMREEVKVYGSDYPTVDGSCVRDYIHVCDLARAHVAALEYLHDGPSGETLTINLGTGTGSSVLEVIGAFEAACNCRVPWVYGSRRPGDIAACYADPSLAYRLLGWEAKADLTTMCADMWRWASLGEWERGC